MVRPLRRLIAPALALMALAGTSTAHANFSVATGIASVTTSTGSVTTTYINAGGLGSNFAFNTNGTTFTFKDYASSNRATSSTPNEMLTASGTTPYAGPAETVRISETIRITNNGVFDDFTQTTNYNLTSTGGLQLVSTSVAPASLLIGGTIFTSGSAQATSNDLSDPSNLSVTQSVTITAAAVPEPASLAMVGLGLVGVGLVARRRRAGV